jgi:hypothetical protein
MSIIKTSQLVLFREIIYFDYDDNMKHKKFVGRIEKLLILQQLVPTITTVI